MQRNVEAFESSCLGHVVLAGHLLFGRAAENPQCARELLFLHVIPERDRGADGGRADQVVATAMSVGIAALGRRLRGLCVIAEIGQSIKLDQQADGRLSAAPGGDPGGVESPDPGH